MSDDQAPTDFIPPELEEIEELLPSFEILSFIAKGGMGAVYLAKQKSLDREVAIKILPRHFGEDEEFRASFETEAKSMAKLNHPNLVGIFDFGQVDGMLYIIMEMVHGETLYHWAYGKTIEPKEAGSIVLGICKGLANAHEQDILHRDIKPANILLGPDNSPKISDFGLARPVGDHEADSAFGTPGYTAPEVVHNPTAVDESTDLYSVGAILYELLTSKLPESPYMPAANLVKCDPRFDDVIRKAMNPKPVLRYRSANEMAEAIEAIITDNNKPAANNKLITAAAPGPNRVGSPGLRPSAVRPMPGRPTPYVKTSSAMPMFRNMIIIVVLLGTIYAAWNHYSKSKVKREAENELIIERNEQVKKKEQKMLKEKRDAIQAAANKSRKPSSKPKPRLIPIPPEPKPRPRPKPRPTAECEELEELREKCHDLIEKYIEEHEQKFTANIKGYENDLNFYLSGLPKNQEAAMIPYIAKMQSNYPDDRIPDNFIKEGMPDKVRRIYETRLRLQDKIKDAFLAETGKLQRFYRKNLTDIIKELSKKGLHHQIPTVEDEIKSTDSSTQDFIEYIID